MWSSPNQATLSGKQAREGVAQVTGMVRASILYQPEGGGGFRGLRARASALRSRGRASTVPRSVRPGASA